MDILSIILIVFGLILFETVSSIDNAVINAQVLSTMSERARRWFLIWGLLIAVFLLRGLLPFGIVFMTNPSLGVLGTITAAFSSDPKVHEAVDQVGIREFRELTKRKSRQSWYNLNKEMNGFNYPKEADTFGILRNALTEFKPLKLVDFQNEMINNDKYTQL